jgi:phosphatidylglycerophosphate synthase
MAFDPQDRRPIASRKHRIWVAASHALVAAGVSANAISIIGMLTAIAAGAAAAMTSLAQPPLQRILWVAVALGVQLRLLANMLDGMVAIESGTASPVGELYNEVPDRISDCAVLVGVGYAVGGSPALGFLAALMAVLTAYIRSACRAGGAPQDFCGPMAKPHRMFVVSVMSLYLAMSPRDWHTVSDWAVPTLVLAAIAAGSAVTAVRRLTRGARHLRSMRP